MQSHRIHPLSLVASILLERWQWRVLILLLSLACTIVGLLAPYSQKQFSEALLTGQPTQKWLALAFLSMTLYQGLWQLNNWVATRESLISQKAIGDRCFHRLLEGPGGLVGQAPAGVAVSLFAVDIPGATALLDQSLIMCSSIIFPIVLAPVVLHSLFSIPWWASIGALLALALINFALAWLQSGFFLAFKQFAADRTGLVSEWVQNIRTLRILGWVESAEQRIFALRERETANRKKMTTNAQLMNSIASTATFSLNLLAILLLLKIRRDGGGGDEPTPSELLSLLWILGVFLTRPLRQLPWMLVMTFDALSSTRRLQAAFAMPITRPSISLGSGALAQSVFPEQYALSARGLNLQFDGKRVLQDIDLDLKPGALVAVVGEVGSGKSSLLRSLIGGTGARFESFSCHGEVTTGPLDPKVRERIAYVPQEGFTISANVRENVLFTYLDGGYPDSDVDARVEHSLKVCQFDPQRENIPHGLDTEIGERGVNLSGGQRQRIGLARSHFSARTIILMDDCLSAIDVNTERNLIDELILGEWRNCTRLIATHRMSILPLCHEIIFLREGKVEIRGRYEELLMRSPAFQEFVRREDRQPLESPSTEAPVLPPQTPTGEDSTQ